jgi:iron complex transport system substrate-binding protein
MARALFTGLLTVLLAAGIADPAAAVPARIVSINLCADELLLALADPSQIAALSVYATDPTLSYVADQAAAFRHDAGEAETVVDLKPDLVLAGSFTKRDTRDILGRLGYRVELLPPARSIDEAIAQIRTVAAIVGHADRGEVLIARVEDARRRAEAAAAALPQRPSAAIYQRRGYVTGGSTLTGDLLSTAGFANAGAPLAGKTGGFVPLERLIAAPPDMIVVTASVKRAEDQGTALLAHPALAALYPPDRRIVLPEKLTVCGGPSLPDALDWLSQQARRVQPAP